MRRLLAAVLLGPAAGCVSTVPAPTLAEATRCNHPAYGLNCVVPHGYVVADEATLADDVLTLRGPLDPEGNRPGITLRALPLGGEPAEALVRDRVFGPLRRQAGIDDASLDPARVGGRSGWEIRIVQRYLERFVRRRIFAFRVEKVVFLVEYQAEALDPVPTPELDAFVASIGFAP